MTLCEIFDYIVFTVNDISYMLCGWPCIVGLAWSNGRRPFGINRVNSRNDSATMTALLTLSWLLNISTRTS